MISKFKQGSDDYLMEQADAVIGKLVKEKTHLFKAYNYYQGFRDRYQFEHLEKNYGVGNPTSVKFTPLIRKHIDAIVGEYLATKVQPKISCKDKRTLTNIMRDKQLEIASRNKEFVSKFLESAIYDSIMGKQQQEEKQLDAVVQQQLKQIQDSVNLNFISNYEIAAQDIIQYVLQSRRMDFKSKLQSIILDLLIAGESYYKVVPTPSKKNFSIEIEDPLNTFVFKSPDSKYMKNGTMSVVRKWMTREEIGIKYGKELSNEDIKSLEAMSGYQSDDERLVWIAAINNRGCARTSGILAGQEVSVMDNDSFYSDVELVPVYEVEWIDYDRKKGKGVLYNVTRIGTDIYVLDGENDYVVRTEDDPDNVRLTLNGLFYTTRTGMPFSLMLATADLQDLYDLSMFQKDNLIAHSGVKGANVIVENLPSWLGATPEERVIKFLGLRKQGVSLISFAEDINPGAYNTAYTGYDDTLSVQSIQGFQLSLQIIEDTASSITGVFRERLGGIQQRDAVANVEVGMQQSYIITKQYYQAMDCLVSEILVDCLDLAKKVYKKGFTGEVVLGNQKEIFTLLPEHYSFTDFDIHLADSADIIKEMDFIRQMAMQLASQNQVDPEILMIVAHSKSLTEMYESVSKSIQQKKIENNQLVQLQQQLEQASQQVQQLQQQLESNTKKIAQYNEDKLNIERANNETQNQIQWFKVKSDADAKDRELDIMENKNKLEMLQVVADDGKQNDAIDHDKV